MNTSFKRGAVYITYGSCILVLLYFLSALVPAIYEQWTAKSYAEEALTSAGGPEKLRLACQQLMRESVGSLHELDISLPTTPFVIRSMNPRSVEVDNDHVMLAIKGRRAGFLVFAEGSPQFGTLMITNGVWYWNGHPSAETRTISQRTESGKSRVR